MSPLVEQALKTFTITCNISHLHVQDEDQIKSTLRALQKHGENIDPSEINDWVLKNNWQTKPAQKITKWAQQISSNGRVQLKFAAYAKSDQEIISHLQERLKVP